MEKRLINFLDLCIDCYYRRNVKSGAWCNELDAQANSAVCRKWRDMEVPDIDNMTEAIKYQRLPQVCDICGERFLWKESEHICQYCNEKERR